MDRNRPRQHLDSRRSRKDRRGPQSGWRGDHMSKEHGRRPGKFVKPTDEMDDAELEVEEEAAMGRELVGARGGHGGSPGEPRGGPQSGGPRDRSG